MHAVQALAVLSAIPTVFAHHEQTLGLFIFHRHGDRTSKAHAPTHLTELGQHQVLSAGDYFRDKYITSDFPIHGVAKDVVVQSQVNFEAPEDVVLQMSAMAFSQGLYPPVQQSEQSVGTMELANGTRVFSPLNLIPVHQVSSAIKVDNDIDPENVAWLQGLSACSAATQSSSSYFESEEFKELEESTREFYQRLVPVINGTFDAAYASFRNAYSIYDLINVATINNKSIPSSELLDKDTIFQLRTLADKQQFGLAYSKEEPVRAIAGAELAAQVVAHLDNVIESKSANQIGVQFGAYATFLSFFGLSQLSTLSSDFTGIVDYASSMTFEIFGEQDMEVEGYYPSVEDISVRFLFSNGSANYVGQDAFPLFGQTKKVLPYKTFKAEMEKFAISTAAQWHDVCGTGGKVEGLALGEKKGGMSLPVAGVIGALVTMVVIIAAQMGLMWIGGLRVVSKREMAAAAAARAVVEKEEQFA